MVILLMAIYSLVAVASCGSTSGAPPTSPDPVVNRPAPDVSTPLQATTKCWGPFRPGERVPLACVVLVTPATGPGSTNIRAFADLSAFGLIYGTTWELIQCPACGSPTFDMDLHIPDGMPPGPKTFPVWATDGQGRRADTTGTLEIRSR
jgi:hypothetical protein